MDKISTSQEKIKYLYFLREDFDVLNTEINKIIDKIKEIGKEVGKSCQEGAETFHDNFALEDSHRQQYMWSTRLRELINIKNQARVIDPKIGDKVSLGCTVTVKDENTGEVRVIKIGSFMVLKEHQGEVISYNAPLGSMLVGGRVGDTKKANISGKMKTLQILKIE